MPNKSHRFAKFLLLALVVLAALVFALPWLLSSAPGRTTTLGMLRGRIPGNLEVDDWRLSWRRSLTVGPFRYALEGTSEPVLEVARINIERGLLGLARAYPDLGTIQVEKPVVRIPAADAGRAGDSTSPSTGAKPSSSPPGSAERGAGDSGSARPAWPSITLKLLVTNGAIAVASQDAPDRPVARDISLALEVNAPGTPSTLALDAKAGTGEGGLSVKGTATVPGDGAIDPLRLPVDIEADVSSFDLAFLQPLLALPGDVPQIDGRIDARVHALGQLADGLQVEGEAGVTALAVPSEELQFDDIELAFAAELTDASAVVDRARLTSGFLELTAEGTYGGAQDGTFNADAEVNLEKVTTLLRHIGAAPTNLEAAGNLTVHAAGRTRKGTAFLEDGEAVLHNLALDLGEGALALTEIRLAGEAAFMPADRTILTSNVTFSSDLATARLTKGEIRDWRDASSTFLADGVVHAGLSDLAREVARIHATGGTSAPLRVEGQLELPFQIQGLDDGMAAMLQPVIHGLALPDHGLAPSDVTGALELRLEPGGLDVRNFTVTTDALSAQGTAWFKEEGAGLSADASCRLDKLTPILHAMDILSGEIGLGGEVVAQVAVTHSGSVVRVTDGTTHITDFSLQRGDREVAQREITLQHSGTADLESRTLTVDTLRMVTDLGAAHVVTGHIDDWSRRPLPLTLEAKADADLEALGSLLSGWGVVDDKLKMQGHGTADLSVTPAGVTGMKLVADASVKDASLQAHDLPAWESETIDLGLTVKADSERERIEVSRADLVSSLADLSATGTILRAGDMNEVQAAGHMAADLDQVTAVIQSFSDMDLTMSGKETGRFRLTSRAPDGADWREILSATEGEADLAVAHIGLLGLELSELTVPLALTGGHGHAEVRGGVNQGALALDPMVDFTVPHPAITLAEATNALVGVQLTSELADSLLGRIHPLFKGATVLGGTMGLRIDSFDWPLEPVRRNTASFAGQMVFEELELGATGMLESILDALKIRERSVVISQRDIDFALEGGRVRTSPTRLRVKGHEMVLEGTMGLDQTLDYHAIVPITEELVGRDVYAYLQGTTFRLPIRGTASKPEVNLSSLQEGLAGLAGQAARKALEEKAGDLLERLLR